MPIETLLDEAKGRFVKMCGFDLSLPRHRKMMNGAQSVLKKKLSGLTVKALVAPCTDAVLEGGFLIVGEQRLYCSLLSRIRKEDFKGAYAYLLTAGEPGDAVQNDIADMFYADTWGTAFVDAGRERLASLLLSPEECAQGLCLSPSLGPGYYGMPLSELPKLFSLLDAQKIGVSLHEKSFLMTPQKTCAGVFVKTQGKTDIPYADCRNCLGNAAGCAFCAKAGGEPPSD